MKMLIGHSGFCSHVCPDESVKEDGNVGRGRAKLKSTQTETNRGREETKSIRGYL